MFSHDLEIGKELGMPTIHIDLGVLATPSHPLFQVIRNPAE
jgi:hypothetical protein